MARAEWLRYQGINHSRCIQTDIAPTFQMDILSLRHNKATSGGARGVGETTKIYNAMRSTMGTTHKVEKGRQQGERGQSATATTRLMQRAVNTVNTPPSIVHNG